MLQASEIIFQIYTDWYIDMKFKCHLNLKTCCISSHRTSFIRRVVTLSRKLSAIYIPIGI
jgi:hypothetical protein